MTGMELDPPPYARYWELVVAELDPPVAKRILTIAYLLVAYRNAAPAPPPSYRELLKGLLLELGGPTCTPGTRLQDFPEDLDWTLPA